jgi:hypothetical protein
MSDLFKALGVENPAETEKKRKLAAEALIKSKEAKAQKPIDAMTNIAYQPAPIVAAPTVDPFFKEAQKGLVNQLQERAEGKGPSIAQMQQKQAGNKALQNTLGSVRAGVGSNAALTARTAALAGGNIQADLANGAAMLRLKEIQDAQGALGNLTTQGRAGDATTRGQDIGVNTNNAGLEMNQRGLSSGIHQSILNNITGIQENALDRDAKIAAAAAAQPKKSNGFMDILPSLIGAGATIFSGGNPAAGILASSVANELGGPNSTPMGPEGPVNPPVMGADGPVRAAPTSAPTFGLTGKPSPVSTAAKRRKPGAPIA